MCVFRVDTTPTCAEPGSLIPQAILCAFSVPRTRAGIRQLSRRFSMLRSALNSLIWDKRHPSEQSLRKWFGFSEPPGVLGFHSREWGGRHPQRPGGHKAAAPREQAECTNSNEFRVQIEQFKLACTLQ